MSRQLQATWIIALSILSGCAMAKVTSSRITPNIQLGMTKAEVIAKCGQPTQASAIKDKSGRTLEALAYKESFFPYGPTDDLTTYVYFSDGKVIYYGGNQNMPTEEGPVSQK